MATAVAEQELLERYHRDGDVASRQELVRRFLPLAGKLARRYGHLDELEDLEQIACLGLLKALDRFDPDRGTSFASYAAPTILGELKRHFRDHRWSVRVPRSLQDRALQVSDVTERMTSERGRPPTPRAVADAMGLPLEHVLEAMEAGSAYTALGLETATEDEQTAPIDRFVIEEPGYERVESALVLAPALAALPDRDRAALQLRFGRDMTQSEIAARLGISQMQVSRLLRRAVARIRAAVGEPARDNRPGAEPDAAHPDSVPRARVANPAASAS